MIPMNALLKILILPLLVIPAHASAATLSIMPESPIQGQPLMISVQGAQSIQGISFDGKKLGAFTWKGMPTAFYGIDLYKAPGTYKIKADLADGTTIEKDVVISKREKIEAPLGIPQKLGGDTPAAATKLVSTLALENASLLGLRTGTHVFWKEKFRYPLADPIVTDDYGYQRQTGGYSIAHKGTDFRAKEGTPVMAMNRGVVRLAREGRNYGKTIVLDHGLGLQTFYMHLSKIYVNVGELVLPGQRIGLSGQTGYAGQPHLH